MTAMGPGRILTIIVAAALAASSLACSKRRERRVEDKAFLSDEVLYQKGLKELSNHNLRKAREYLERIQFSPERLADLQPMVRLAMADITFYHGDDLSLIEARSKYLDFVTLNGDHPMAPYAQFQAGVCSLEQVNHPSKDQGETRSAISDLKETLRRYPLSYYAQAAQDMIDVAESNLAEHDFIVGRFYHKRKVPLAASERYRRALDRYPRYRHREKLYFYLGRSLLEGNKDAEASAYLERLMSDYPESSFAKDARKFLATFPGSKKGDSKEKK